MTACVEALVIKNINMQRYKLHEALTINESGAPLFKSEAHSYTNERLSSDAPLDDTLLDDGRRGPKAVSPDASLSVSSGDTSASNSDSTITGSENSVKLGLKSQIDATRQGTMEDAPVDIVKLYQRLPKKPPRG